MRFLRIRHGGLSYWARQADEATARLWTSAPYAGGTETDRLIPIKANSLLPPVEPTKIVCIGRNYRDHARELGNEVPAEPIVFLKPPSSLLASGGAVRIPSESNQVEHEGELAVVIGQRLSHGSDRDAQDAIFGLTGANDVTARDLQKKDGRFTRAKGFDTFCPIGPFLETEFPPIDELTIRTLVNGEVRQDGKTSDMIWNVVALLRYVSKIMTFEPGDVLLTGTPKGVGPLLPGDRVEVAITGLTSLVHSVVTAASPNQ